MRVLLVEDNPDDVALARRAIIGAVSGTEIDVARDGQEAVDVLSQSSNQAEIAFDLVLLDLKLPRLDGLDVLRHVRSAPVISLVPIVMLTSSDESGDVRACYQAGVNGYIRKPSDLNGYMAEVGAAARFWLATNILPRTA